MKKKKAIIISLSVILAICLVVICLIDICLVVGGIFMSKYFLWLMPSTYIENHLIKEFPLGSSSDEVLQKLKEHKEWDSNYALHPIGIKYDGKGSVMLTESNSCYGDEYFVGTQMCKADMFTDLMGYYTAKIYFAFDDDGKLIDIAVYKKFSLV